MNTQAQRNYKKNQNRQTASYIMKFVALLLVACLLVAWMWIGCNMAENPLIEIKHKTYKIDSVEYHPIGGDNTLQTTPYWKVHLETTPYWISSYRMYSVGDSITVTEKRLIEKKNTKVEKTQE